MMPVVPGLLLATGLVVLGHDLGTALVLFAILLGMLWVVGAPARFFAIVVPGRRGVRRRAGDDRARSGSPGSPTSPTRARLPRRRLAARPRPLRAVQRRLFGQGIGASQQKWGNLPEAHTDFIFAVLGEELGLVGTLLVVGLFLTIAYAAIRVARRTEDPFVRYMTFGIVVWLLGQMMINVGHGAGSAAGHRHPAAAGLVRRVGAVPSLVALGMLRRLRAPRARGRPGAAPGRKRARRDWRRRRGPVTRRGL